MTFLKDVSCFQFIVVWACDGFWGFILKQDKQAAKYVNSPESELYQKVKFYRALSGKTHIATENCYLVEDIDVIQMHHRFKMSLLLDCIAWRSSSSDSSINRHHNLVI